MGNKTSAESSTKESCQLSDGVVWKAYRFDKQGKPIKKEWDLTEDAGNRFSWYHVELPNRNQKLRSFEEIFMEKLCPPLKEEDVTRMVSGEPFCDYVDGALFLRVNSSVPSIRNFRFRLAARITKNSVITMSLDPNLKLDVFPENQNLVRNDEMVELDEIVIEKGDGPKNSILVGNDEMVELDEIIPEKGDGPRNSILVGNDEMVELDEIVIEKGDGPKNSNLVRNKEKGVAAKNEIEEGEVESRSEMNEEGDVESRSEMNEEEADNLVVKTVGNLLVHIVNSLMDHLQDTVNALEFHLDMMEESMEIAPGGGTLKIKEMWDEKRLGELHLDLQRLLKVTFPQMEQVFHGIQENFSKKDWWIPDRDLRAVIGRLGRLKENVEIKSRWVAVMKEDFDSRLAMHINEKLYYLSILSLFLLPLSFITGIFGLSVGGIPWRDHKDGFRNVLLVCVVMTVVLLACRTFRVLYKLVKKVVLRVRMIRATY